MNGLPEFVKQRPINRICIPGSHDSGSYFVDFTDMNVFIRPITKLGFVQNIFEAWIKTQNKTILEQLNMGIRSFDLRVTYSSPLKKYIPIPSTDTNYYITHTFVCETLDSVLDQFETFLINNPSEIVVIQIKPDFINESSITIDQDNEIVNKFVTKFGSLLTPETSIFPSYNYMIENKQQIIFSYQNLNNTPKVSQNWSASHFNEPWDNTSNLTTKEQDMDVDMNNFQLNDSTFNAISFTLTPQTSDVVSDILKRVFLPCCFKSNFNSVEKMAEEIENYFNDFVQKYKLKLNYLSSFTFDFPQQDYINQTIKFNY